MIGEINLNMSFVTEKMLKNKQKLTNVVKGVLGQMGLMGTIKDITVEHIYVFGTGKEGALLCYRKEEDDKEFYRGGMSFYRSDIDSAKKAFNYFKDYKEILDCNSAKWINRRKPLLLKTSNVKVILET